MDSVTDVAASEQPRVCFVKFRNAGRVYPFAAGAHELRKGELVLVDHEQTLQVGIVQREPAPSPSQTQAKIVRALTPEDAAKVAALRMKEREAFKFALEKLRLRRIPAKMVAAELSFNEDRLVFYFASEERLDFRHIIRDLAAEYRARVEVRQIGARDAAKIIGGIGSCGRALCCSTWLVEFRPVSIKMAKDQNLALNPQKVSGVCGRLLCCLTYEQETYKELRKGLPKIGKRVYTPSGDGRVKDVNVLRRRVRVQTIEGYEEFEAEQVSPMFGPTGELLPKGELVLDEPETEEGAEGVEAKTDGSDRPASEKPGVEKTISLERAPSRDRPAPDRTGDRPRPDRSGDRPRGERPQRDRPGGERPLGDRPPRDGDRPRGDRPPRDGDRPRGDRPPRDPNAPRGDRPPRDPNAPRGDRPPRDPNAPRGDRPPRDPNAPRGDRPPRQDQPRRDGHQQGQPHGERPPRQDQPRQDQPRGDRPPRDPNLAPQEPRDPNAPPLEGGTPAAEAEGQRRRRRRRRGGRGGGGGGGGGGAPGTNGGGSDGRGDSGGGDGGGGAGPAGE